MLDMVQRATADAVQLVGGGFVDTPNQRIAVRLLTGICRAEDLEEMVVDKGGGSRAMAIGCVLVVVILVVLLYDWRTAFISLTDSTCVALDLSCPTEPTC
jgi:Cu/Ag efflux pump CusA